MFIDQQCVLWDAVALTTSAYSTNSYDCGAIPSAPVTPNGAAPDPSVGEPLALVISVGVAADHTTGDESYSFEVTQSASTTASSSPDTLVAVTFTATQAATLLAAGAVIVVPIPAGSITKRYISGHYTGGGTTPTITVTGWIAPIRSVYSNKFYSSAIVVSV